LNNKEKFSNQSWNFGPNNQSKHKSVLDIINLINKEFNNNIKIIKNKKNYARTYLETKFLTLNSLKAKKILKWKTKYNIKDVIKLTSNWQKNFLEGCDMLKFSRKQILDYFN
jgi:UDP-glucose 4-epimerase